MKWFVFIDTEYYPYVGDPVEAETAAEALAQASAYLSIGETVYVAPASVVTEGTVEGPRQEPMGLLALMEEMNRIREAQMQALRAAFPGKYEVRVEPGSVASESHDA
jgi:hypothetical protein